MHISEAQNSAPNHIAPAAPKTTASEADFMDAIQAADQDAALEKARQEFLDAMQALDPKSGTKLQRIRKAKDYVRYLVGDLQEQLRALKAARDTGNDLKITFEAKESSMALTQQETAELEELKDTILPSLEAKIKMIEQKIQTLMEQFQKQNAKDSGYLTHEFLTTLALQAETITSNKDQGFAA